jgi:hypothetical protein
MEIWNAGDSTSNVIESVHADVNREGVGCTLVGAVKKGQAFDTMKMRGLKVSSTISFIIHRNYYMTNTAGSDT